MMMTRAYGLSKLSSLLSSSLFSLVFHYSTLSVLTGAVRREEG